MRVQIQEWGNSLALRIPKPLAQDAGVREGTVVDLSLSEGRLVMTPIHHRKVALKDLIGRVKKHNVHDEAGTGLAVGREAW